MSQTKADPTHRISRKLTTDEAQKLADRLQSRGVSTLLDDQPELQRDMRAAAQVIRALLNKIDHAEAICAEAARQLCDFTIKVGGR
jgi:hypothetical protein